MDRKTFLKAMAGAAAAPAVRSQGRKRSLVFILVDDHRFDMLGAAGHPWLKTPNLDRLMRSGAAFRNGFVTTSLCSPSRASILTGQYMHAHKVTDNFTPLDPKIPTFPQLLREEGYRTAFVGKWHMGGDSDEARPGFDHWVSFYGQGEYFDPMMNRNGKRERSKGYMTDILTGEAVQFIRDNAQRPFLLYLSHKAVHHEFKPAPRHKDLYSEESVPRPKSMPYKEEYYEQLPEWMRRRRYSRHGVDGMFDHTGSFDEFYRDYCRCLMAVDEGVGEVMRELERTGLDKDTLVIYMGDNGYLWGEHGLVDKRAMYEESIRVPFLARCPALFEGGRTLDQMALNLDVGPTLLDAAGLKTPAGMHGRSLLPVLQGKATDWRKEFVYEYEWERDYPYTPTIVGLRSERYSFIQSYGLWDIDELYDLQADPEQRNNLLRNARIIRQRGRMWHQIQDEGLRKTVTDLQKRMAKILAETGGDPRLSGLVQEGDKLAW